MRNGSDPTQTQADENFRTCATVGRLPVFAIKDDVCGSCVSKKKSGVVRLSWRKELCSVRTGSSEKERSQINNPRNFVAEEAIIYEGYSRSYDQHCGCYHEPSNKYKL
jgi:hypothetical protein